MNQPINELNQIDQQQNNLLNGLSDSDLDAMIEMSSRWGEDPRGDDDYDFVHEKYDHEGNERNIHLETIRDKLEDFFDDLLDELPEEKMMDLMRKLVAFEQGLQGLGANGDEG